MSMVPRLVLCLALTAGAAGTATRSADAAPRLCAFRSGANGPCTCKVDDGPPGEFTVVARKFCAKAKPEDAKAPEAGVPADGAAPVSPKAEAAPAAPTAPADPQPAAQAPAAETAPAAEAPPTPAADQAATPAATPSPDAKTTPASPPAAAPGDAAPPAAIPSSSSSGRLAAIRARGKLLCGVNGSLAGFSALSDSGTRQGLDADFCRAVAAAVFDDPAKVEFVVVETDERFEALTSGRIDLLARNATWTMEREVTMGLAFAGVLYFDGQGFMTSDERGLVSAQQLEGLKVCVEAGTTTEKNMAYYFASHELQIQTQTFPGRKELLDAYASGACDAYSGDRSALFSDRAGFAEPAKHAVLPEVISKEPLGPVVARGDDAWTEIVRWTLAGLINAEEVGLDRAMASTPGELKDDPQRLVEGAGASGEKLGLSKTWLRNVVASVGNYGELFEANLGRQSPLGMERGINALWKRGGLQFAPPMW
jgi:general L-amino acid transport system substrate-binding protein